MTDETPESPLASAEGARPLNWSRPGDWLALVLIFLVRIYQWTLSPLFGRQCRFEPSCSRYFIGAVRKYGAIIGAWKGICRIGRCHPWHPGGYDPP
jgi:putative membrane protein insertion efficiency factor